MDRDGARRFSPAYFADILRDFDVSMALCCAGAGHVASYDPAALQERGIAVETLPVEARSGHLLAAGDRLLTLARAAPGAIALHGAGGCNWAAWADMLINDSRHAVFAFSPARLSRRHRPSRPSRRRSGGSDAAPGQGPAGG